VNRTEVHSISKPPHLYDVATKIFPPYKFKLMDWFPRQRGPYISLFYSGNNPQKIKYSHYGFSASMAFRRS
jgi:hypothetical protein